ncbi:hypothetical protein NQZ68_039384 [Dissostichus eleginoides]|nr:hypothetical protein NQZ68_039384 [Dissostichus eleginoides]
MAASGREELRQEWTEKSAQSGGGKRKRAASTLQNCRELPQIPAAQDWLRASGECQASSALMEVGQRKWEEWEVCQERVYPKPLWTPDAHSDLGPLSQTPPGLAHPGIGTGTDKLTIIIYLTALASKLTGRAAFVWLECTVTVCLRRVNECILIPTTQC